MTLHQPVSGSGGGGGGGGGVDLTEYLAPSLVEGRLTLTTGTPITTSDVTAATTLYFTPFNGNTVGLYDGSSWGLHTLSEISIAVPAQASQMYDVFLYDNSGVLTLELTAWTNDTTRATALTTQDGVYVKTGALTRRYLGSFRTTTSAGQTEDSLAKRHVWNYYSRVPRPLYVADATANWTYSTATWRPTRNQTTNRVQVVIGLSETPILISAVLRMQVGNNAARGATGIGIDSTNTNSAQIVHDVNSNDPDYVIATGSEAHYVGYPAIGFHYFQWLEIASTGTPTFYGQPTSDIQSGLMASVEG